jgi:hypothetical protein
LMYRRKFQEVRSSFRWVSNFQREFRAKFWGMTRQTHRSAPTQSRRRSRSWCAAHIDADTSQSPEGLANKRQGEM